MRIVDCFPYFNEREVLELRIRLLSSVVNEFIITEGSRTHTGKEKLPSCEATLRELGLFSDKIRIITVDLPDKSTVQDNWIRENLQRDAAAKYITDDTVAIISDLDEIINPAHVLYYATVAKNNPGSLLRIPMWCLVGRADLHLIAGEGNPAMWASPFMCMKNHSDRYSLSKIRQSHSRNLHNIDFKDIFITQDGAVTMAGWHFTWMGTSNRRIEKFQSIADNGDALKTAVGNGAHDAILRRLSTYVPEDKGNDPLGRKDHVLRNFSLSNLPREIFNLPRVKEFLIPSARKKTIVFFEEQLGVRGTTAALRDYARYASKLLDLNVFVAYNPKNSNWHVLQQLHSEFSLIGVSDSKDLDQLLTNLRADYFYEIKYGRDHGYSPPKFCRHLVHSVFNTNSEFVHGDRYAVVSKTQAEKSSPKKIDYVPHMCCLPEEHGNLRKDLGIPAEAFVFGRHGGSDTFNIQFVKDAIPQILEKRPDVWFLFLNTDKFISHNRVIHLAATSDEKFKVRFINSCNAMLHARDYGETFGLAVLEFAMLGKPVFTYRNEAAANSHPLGGTSHYDILGDSAINYYGPEDLIQAAAIYEHSLDTKVEYKDLERFRPEAVMERFKQVFLT